MRDDKKRNGGEKGILGEKDGKEKDGKQKRGLNIRSIIDLRNTDEIIGAYKYR